MTPDATILSRQYADLLRANGCSERTIDNYLYALKLQRSPETTRVCSREVDQGGCG